MVQLRGVCHAAGARIPYTLLLGQLFSRHAVLLLLSACVPCFVLQVVYDAADPVSAPLPSPWASKLDAFQRLLLLRMLRPDKLTTAINEFVKQAMGARFVEPPPLDIDRCFKDSSAMTPLIFVLSPGSDPMSMLLKYAEGLKVQVRDLAAIYCALVSLPLHGRSSYIVV
jgi:hypothetical protein